MLFTDEPNVVNDRKEVNNYSGKVYVTHAIHLLAVPCEFEDCHADMVLRTKPSTYL